jgi:hypothetical protein
VSSYIGVNLGSEREIFRSAVAARTTLDLEHNLQVVPVNVVMRDAKSRLVICMSEQTWPGEPTTHRSSHLQQDDCGSLGQIPQDGRTTELGFVRVIPVFFPRGASNI